MYKRIRWKIVKSEKISGNKKYDEKKVSENTLKSFTLNAKYVIL